MADKENCSRLTRAAAKRAPAAIAAEQRPKKMTRVALGELPTLSNTTFDVSTPDRAIGKPKYRSKAAKKSFSVNIRGEEDLGDPQICHLYVSDIYSYLRSMEAEEKRRPLAGCLESIQRDVNPNMRGILVDWLVEVAEEYKLISDTLYLTVSYIDRYLSYNPINKQRLQLLGVSAMLIASKYEEITPPNVEDFCYITDNTYSKKQVVEMESEILRFLKFEMGNPTIKTFLRRFIKFAQEDGNYPNLLLEFLGYYLGELSLLDYKCVEFLPSIVAASIIFIARFSINQENPPWNKNLQQCTSYKVSELKECIYLIHDLQLKKRGSNLMAIREKYKHHRFKFVSSIVSPDIIPRSFLEDVEVKVL